MSHYWFLRRFGQDNIRRAHYSESIRRNNHSLDHSRRIEQLCDRIFMIDKGRGDFWWNGESAQKRRSLTLARSLWRLIWPLIDKEIASILNLIVHATSRLILSSKPCLIWNRVVDTDIEDIIRPSEGSKMIVEDAGIPGVDYLSRVNFLLLGLARCHGGLVGFLSLLIFVWESCWSGVSVWRISPSEFCDQSLWLSQFFFGRSRWLHYHALATSAFAASSLHQTCFDGWFLSLAFPFLIVLMKVFSGQRVVEVLINGPLSF